MGGNTTVCVKLSTECDKLGAKSCWPRRGEDIMWFGGNLGADFVQNSDSRLNLRPVPSHINYTAADMRMWELHGTCDTLVFSLTFCIYRETPRLSWWGQGLHIGYCTWWWSTRSVITCEFFKCWSGTRNHRTPWWSYWSDLEQASTTLIRLIRDSQEFHADQMSIY